MANDCLNIGIIGAGKISELHASGYLKHPKARIVAVADNSCLLYTLTLPTTPYV